MLVLLNKIRETRISSLQVDTIGKECLETKKHLYYFKDTVPIAPLGMVDDLLTISECGVKTNLLNQYINFKTGIKRLQLGEFTMVSQPIRLILVDFFKGCFPFFFGRLNFFKTRMTTSTKMKTTKKKNGKKPLKTINQNEPNWL